MVVLFGSAEVFILGAVNLAKIFRIPPLVIGLAAMVAPLPVADKIMNFDIWVMLGATVLMLPILAGRWRFKRPGAALFLILYGAYIAANGYSPGLFGGG